MLKLPLPLRFILKGRVIPARVIVSALLVAVVLVPAVELLRVATHAQNQQSALPTVAGKQAEFVPGELLVRFRPAETLAKTKGTTQLSMASGGRSLRVEINSFGGSDLVEGLMLARISPERTLDAIKALRARPDVLYAEPNYIRHFDAVPNDSFYGSQWPLKNSPSSIGGGISAESAWDTTTGNQNIVVGVIDSGIDIDHRDLKDNIFTNTAETPNNNVDDDNNGFVDDVNGWDFINHDRTVFDNANDDFHGTHVAGIIGARGNNSAGIAGVNWNVQLLPLKAIGPGGGTDSVLLEAYNYAKALRQRGVNLRVLNNSYGGQAFSQSLLDAIKELGNADILFVAAAGNDTLNNDFVPHFPATFDLPNVISVAASTQGGFFASEFSNRGAQTVHLAAPGDEVLSTTPHGYTGTGLVPANTDPDGSTYSNISGTSMAAPHVTGAAALAVAANPSIPLQKLRSAVLFGVDESGVFFTRTITSGRLNANRTVQFALENDTTPPATSVNPEFHINSQDGRSVIVFWRTAGDDGMTGRASLEEFLFTDSTTGEVFRLNQAVPGNAGTSTSRTLQLPFGHTSGQLSLRTTDNVGNTSIATVSVTVPLNIADPYTVSAGPASPLTALNSGTPVGPKADDITQGISLPFPFPFFGQLMTGVNVSSNGALYFTNEMNPSFGPFDFAIATEPNLNNLPMIAGMWADLRTDRNSTDNVYMVKPDLDHVIFRWQAVTFGDETPVNFEIELRRDGTIQTRYGNGNVNLKRVIVGISGGDPDAYLVGSHSSETGPLSLTNAQTVTFALRNPPPPPVSDLAVKLTVAPEPVVSGQNLVYLVELTNLGPNPADLPVMTVLLPSGTTFVSCATQIIGATCTNTSGTVTGGVNVFGLSTFVGSIPFVITVRVDAPAGASLQASASVTSARPDPNPGNNSASVTSNVVAQVSFGNIRAIGAGNSHTTSVRNDGTVWTWGVGSQGQLGDGTSGTALHPIRAVTPLQVPGIDGVDSVEDSNTFVLALKSNGTVWGWGNNFNAQLGDGTSISPRTRPVQTVGLTNVKGIAAGDFSGAAVKTDGTVWIWGAPVLTGGFNLIETPIQLGGIANVTAIAGGARHLLMLKTDKTVWAIGVNAMGQLGTGNTTNSTTPVQVAGLSNVARIAAGEEFSLALKEDGTIWAWGINFNGQLGPAGGNTDFSPHPNAVQVTGLPGGMTNIAGGNTFCLALASDGTIWSWGNNSSSQLGHGSGSFVTPTPGQIPNFGNVISISAGLHHSVALKSDGSVWGWGLNSEGELGDGTTNTVRLIPVRASGLLTVNSPVINPAAESFSIRLL